MSDPKKTLPRWVSIVAIVLVVVVAQLLFIRAIKQEYAKMLVQHGTNLLKNPSALPTATAASKQAVSLNSYDGYAWFNYGTSIYLQKDFPQAIQLLDESSQYLPHSYNALRLIAFSNYNLKEFAQATEQFRSYLEMIPSPDVSPDLIYRTAGLSALRVADMADANFWLMQAAMLSDEKPAVLREQIMAAVLSNRLGTAEYATRLFRFYAPDAQLSPFEIVANAARTKKLPLAIRYLEMILPKSDGDLSVVKALAAAYSSSGEAPKAEGLILEAIKQKPEDPTLYLALGDILYTQKRYPEAFAQYDKHLALEPDSRLKGDIEQKRKEAGL